MLEGLLALTSLPNLHPAVVHFPLALVPTALLCDLLALTLRRHLWLDRAAALLWTLGGAAALAAYLAGLNAEEQVERGLAPGAEALLYDHREWALRALIVLGVAVAARLFVLWRRRGDTRVRLGVLRLLVLLLGGLSLATLALTADRGGGLVYHWGVATGSHASSAGAGG